MIKIDVQYQSGRTESLIMSDTEAGEEIERFLKSRNDPEIKQWMSKMKGKDIPNDFQYGDGSWDLNNEKLSDS
tara:strand:+ start:260 stop:478 length:219 start_codon:yes stop_codon:yes gene_type:complete